MNGAPSSAGVVPVCYVESNEDETIGGSYFSLLYLVKNLDPRAIRPVVVFGRRNDLVPQFEAAGARVVILEKTRPLQLGVPEKPRGFLPRAAWYCEKGVQRIWNVFRVDIGMIRRIASLLAEHGIRLVHLNSSVCLNRDWMIAARWRRIPCVTHERTPDDFRYRRGDRWNCRHLLRAVLCISDSIARNLERQGFEGRKLHRVPNGLDPSEIVVRRARREVLAEWGLAPDTLLLVLCGNIRHWKGPHVAVEAMPAVLSKYPESRLLLAGGASVADAEYAAALNRRIGELDLAGRVIQAGFRRDVHDLMAAADLVLHTSIVPEPFGRVILEAMALRQPVIAAAAGGPVEIVAEGETGLLVPPGSPAALAKAVNCLLADPVARRAMGEAGHRRLVECFSIEANVQRTVSVYRSVLNSFPAAGSDPAGDRRPLP
jgi:glycosyltransferase involved in cell wall biosynthesis